MSPVSLAMNLLLAVLLLLALGFGWRLERRLKALKAGHADFTKAVADLDRAAMRASAGLAELRVATDESIDLLSSRIERARELAGKLEKLNDNAAATVERLATQPRREPMDRPAAHRTPPIAEARSRPRQAPHSDPVAAVENLILRLSEQDMIETAPTRAPPAAPRPARARAPIDDDLFEGPAAGALRNPTGARR